MMLKVERISTSGDNENSVRNKSQDYSFRNNTEEDFIYRYLLGRRTRSECFDLIMGNRINVLCVSYPKHWRELKVEGT